MAPERNPDLVALLNVLARPPVPSPDERATPLVLLERCRLAGFDRRQSMLLVSYLAAPDVVRACELVEAGCDPHTAGRIVA